ncbi:peptide-methionine (S)-S-oxide reductase MsrA [Mucilaginibacter sabulilitoris]|uniref:Peptide methionine sulfoxide reductase MsrA n=1 Tax=Mucilaginibacter sabulilitoris TaxID=1173583 RepID=A0ABZ0TYT3_9SPHI|nr:peptide-methionine (S)-S-oxide reductase MsrA [Mucilaginibacter sabulilitoris]WPU96979.1 peptide-methionine (S)-S-oxide reductase MsrA [Mucilaginibacter sabulilitoris]
MESKAIFASGCFWGTQYYLKKARGVISTIVGYTGGNKDDPTYQEVSTGRTGHAEAVEVTFDPSIISYEELGMLFFETHDQGQKDGQGPDIGNQYRSAIFYLDENQKEIAEKLVSALKNMSYPVATEITMATKFWKAEDYHQNYYDKKHAVPYCHLYMKKFFVPNRTI